MKRKPYKLTKNCRTVDDLLSRGAVRDFLEDFISNHLVDVEQLAIIFVGQDGNASIGVCGFDSKEELVGIMQGLQFTLLMGDDDEGNEDD